MRRRRGQLWMRALHCWRRDSARTGAYIKVVFGRLRSIVQKVIAAVVYRA